MTIATLQEKLIEYLQDAHALEQRVQQALAGLISATKDREMLDRLRQHQTETEEHERLVRERLNELGASPSLAAQAMFRAGACGMGLVEAMRTDGSAKNARDLYLVEQAEIATYELLERMALQASDPETARIAREIALDEEAMAQWIAGRWDWFVELTLEEAGLVSEDISA